MDPAKRKWFDQRQNARRRGIDWDLPFDAWIKLWTDSGHWHERGKSRNAYVMSRPGDQGPYSVDNVVIKTNYDNVREGNVGRKKPQVKCSCMLCRTVISVANTDQHYNTTKCRKKALRRGLSTL
jgi:hypothetical protein